jgi:predicted MFS family arabinose efflux permease
LPGDGKAQPRLLIVLVLIMAAGPMVSYTTTALGPLLTSELRINPAHFGLFATASFVSATIFSRLLAEASDRLPLSVQLTTVFVFASFAFLILAAARDLWWALAAAIVSGPAHALSNPLTNRIIAARVKKRLRARWMGVKQSGVQCSQALAGLIVPLAAVLVGWRVSVIVLAVALLSLLLWASSYFRRHAAPERVTAAPGRSDDQPQPVPSAPDGLVLRFAGYAMFSGAGLQATNVYLPLFAHEALGFSELTAGLTVALAGTVGLSARIFWGRVMERGGDAATLLFRLAALAFGGVLCLALAQVLAIGTLLWAGVVLHGVTAIGSNVIIMAGAIREVPVSRAGATSATIATGMYLGFASGPLAMSIPLSSMGNFTYGWFLVAGCYACALLTMSSLGGRRR